MVILEPAIRTCLHCGKKFNSKSKGNRCCPHCYELERYLPSPGINYITVRNIKGTVLELLPCVCPK